MNRPSSPVKRCVRCSSVAPLRNHVAEVSREVAGHLFVAFVPARECTSCGESYFDSAAVECFELHVAMRLVDAGLVNGDAFRFMRKALRMHASELAELLDVAPETVSRWETEKRAVTRGACAIVAGLVRDAFEGRTVTVDNLRRLQRPHTLDRRVTIEIAAGKLRAS